MLAAVALIAAVLVFGWLRSEARPDGQTPAEVLDPDSRTPDGVDDLPASSSFGVVPVVATARSRGVPPAPQRGPDSVAAVRFKEALRNLYAVDVAERALPVGVARAAGHRRR